MPLNWLVIGKGAREHALAWKLKQSSLTSRVIAWPGNPAMHGVADPVEASDDRSFTSLLNTIKNEGIDAVVVGPEAPLADGVADALRAASIPCFGPLKAVALLETSKSFAKKCMVEAGIPTAEYVVVRSEAECRQAAHDLLSRKGAAVIKASGLAAGKGVFVCGSAGDVETACDRLFSTMAASCEEVVIEECLVGRESSCFLALGQHGAQHLGFAVDFKRLEDGDQGPNTGGMGSYTPVPWLPADARAQIDDKVVAPLIHYLGQKGLSYVGFLYVGLMWTEAGPKVIEFNVRLGDPEAQVISVHDSSDWAQLIAWQLGLVESYEAKDQDLGATVGVVLAGNAYPYGEAKPLTGTVPQNQMAGMQEYPESAVFGASFAGAAAGQLQTGAGRVLTVTAKAESFQLARQRAYDQVEKLVGSWPGARWRRDIAARVSEESRV